MKTTLRFYEWQSVDDIMPEHKDMVLIWRWGMPFVGYYDMANNYWVVDGNSHVDGVEYWKDIQRP